LKILKGKPAYPSLLRNHVQSRKANNYEGHSIKLESVHKLDWIGSDEELLTMALEMPTVVDRMHSRHSGKQMTKSIIQLTKLADPMFKALTDAIVFNISLETATRFTLTSFVDKSPDDLTSSKLRNLVLYFETKSCRYELCRILNETTF
jgi:hypothetical protein